MESVKQVLNRKPTRQTRLILLLVSSAIIVATSLFAYNQISYQFPLAVGNTGQSALGPSTSAGVGIVYAIVAVAAILGFGVILSVYGSLRNVSSRLTEIVGKDSSPKGPTPGSQRKPEWEDASDKKESKATDEEILQALWHSKDKKTDAAE